MMHWFRFWHGAISSPKVLRLSPRLRWGWIQMLCVASANSERGTLPPTADLRFHLGMSEKKVRSIIDKLVEAGLIDCDGDSLRMHDWDEWQYESDSSTGRLRRPN